MDSIECGIVKLPRVPVADNVPGNEMPMYRELWKHIRTRMPGQGRGKVGGFLDPAGLPPELRTALDALYGHYEQTFGLWEEAGLSVPPCFIIVCHNIAASKLVYDYVSGFHRTREDGSRVLENGHFELFRNFDRDGPALRPPPHPVDQQRTARIRGRLRPELPPDGRPRDRPVSPRDRRAHRRPPPSREPGRRGPAPRGHEHRRKGGKARRFDTLRGLRVHAERRLGRQYRHPRAGGPGLRHPVALRAGGRARPFAASPTSRTGEELFAVEYADVLGIPFDFTATPVAHAAPAAARDRSCEGRPGRSGTTWRSASPGSRATASSCPRTASPADFNEDSVLELTPELVGATETRNSGIIGETVDLDLAHTGGVRTSQVVYELTSYLFARQVPGRERRTAAAPVRATEAHRPPVAGQPSRLQGRNLRFAVGVQDDRRHGLPKGRRRHHALAAREGAPGESDEGRSRSLQPEGIDGARQLPDLQDEPVRDRPPAAATSTGPFSTVAGKRSCAGWSRAIRRWWPG